MCIVCIVCIVCIECIPGSSTIEGPSSIGKVSLDSNGWAVGSGSEVDECEARKDGNRVTFSGWEAGFPGDSTC